MILSPRVMVMDESQIATLLQAAATMPHGTYELVVLDGADAGKRIRLDGSQPGRLSIGTSPSCALVLADREVSRRHVSLELEGSSLRVVDMESTNGTYIDHVRVRDASLRGGERIRVGATTLGVVYDPAGTNPEVPLAQGFGRMLGQSRAMRRLYPLCAKLASARVPVLIEGETGTGKEVLAEALHEQGPWANQPYAVFDCTAVPANLIESELFGHEKGAFTGAVTSRRGVFEQAHKGTLLIDEIGDLELPLQAKLLRAVARGEIRRVGSERAIRVDVRVLCATRRNLDEEVQAGRFRDDLFHRLAVTRIELPPLRARDGDIRQLANAFWQELGDGEGAPSHLLRRWETHRWPGNVRELRNAVERAIALGDDGELTLPDDPAPAGSARPNAMASPGSGFMETVLGSQLPWSRARALVLEELERRYLESVLAQHNGVVSAAAAASGVARRHFQRIMARQRDPR